MFAEAVSRRDVRGEWVVGGWSVCAVPPEAISSGIGALGGRSADNCTCSSSFSTIQRMLSVEYNSTEQRSTDLLQKNMIFVLRRDGQVLEKKEATECYEGVRQTSQSYQP